VKKAVITLLARIDDLGDQASAGLLTGAFLLAMAKALMNGIEIAWNQLH